jgi:5-methylcytosine-specific restriction endonuclease McrA
MGQIACETCGALEERRAPTHRYCVACRRQRDLAKYRRWDAKNRPRRTEAAKRFRQEHPERRRAVEAKWYAAHGEAKKAKRRAQRAADPGPRREAARLYRAKYPERSREATRRWQAKNPQAAARHVALRNARKRAADTRLITDQDWRRLVARHRGCCAYCDKRTDRLQQEHVIPISRGGRHAIGNLLPACPRCNQSKKDKLLIEWRALHKPEVIARTG